jgi:hypothetical protein
MKDNSEISKITKPQQTIKDIKDFLISIKSIGVLTANRIVNRGGLQTLEIIQIGISLLGKIKGVGPVKQIAIYTAVDDLFK